MYRVCTAAGNLTIIGPYNLIQGGIGIVGMQAIFVNAPENETFNVYDGKRCACMDAGGWQGLLNCMLIACMAVLMCLKNVDRLHLHVDGWMIEASMVNLHG